MRASAYAKALHETLREHPQDEDRLVKHFVATVLANGHAHLLPRIAKSFARLTEKSERKATIEVTSAQALSEQEVVALLKKEPFSHVLSPLHKRVVRNTDDTIIGGVIVQAGTTRIDASYKRALTDIYHTFAANL